MKFLLMSLKSLKNLKVIRPNIFILHIFQTPEGSFCENGIRLTKFNILYTLAMSYSVAKVAE